MKGPEEGEDEEKRVERAEEREWVRKEEREWVEKGERGKRKREEERGDAAQSGRTGNAP